MRLCLVTLDPRQSDYVILSGFLFYLFQLFNTLDHSHTGILTADNLFEELSRIDSEITYSDVEDVLRKVDKDGDGQIDFDEFLYHMTNMGGDLFGDDSGKLFCTQFAVCFRVFSPQIL